MLNSRDILNAFVSENVVEGKKLINEALFARLGNALEQKLVDYAPTVFNEAYRLQGANNKRPTDKKGSIPTTDKEKSLAAETSPKDRITQGDVIARRKKGDKKHQVEENYDSSDTDEMIIEQFQNEIFQIVQEIQEETGEEMTAEDIQEIAEEYLQILESTEE